MIVRGNVDHGCADVERDARPRANASTCDQLGKPDAKSMVLTTQAVPFRTAAHGASGYARTLVKNRSRTAPPRRGIGQIIAAPGVTL